MTMVIVLALAVSIATAVSGQPRKARAAKPTGADWTQWGGPHRNFTTQAAGLADSWPAAGPRVVWKRALGEGYSSLLVEEGTLYTMYGKFGQEMVLAADAATGKTLWEHATEVRFANDARDLGNGPHATGLIVGERLFTAGVTGRLQCLDKKTGKVLWTQLLLGDLEGTRLVYGYASSPVAYRDLVIVPVGGRGRALMAFRQGDGSVAWQAQDFANAYSSPMVVTVDGLDQLVAVMDGVMFAVNPLNGDLQWQVTHRADFGLNIAAPHWGPGNRLFVSSEYNAGGRMIELKREANRVTARELWSSDRLKVHHGYPAQFGDVLYFSSGGKGSVAVLTAVEASTGKLLWQDRVFSKATFVSAGDRVIVLDQDGDVALVKLSAQGSKVVSRASLLASNAWTPPTLVGTRLYLRDRREMTAVEVGR